MTRYQLNDGLIPLFHMKHTNMVDILLARAPNSLACMRVQTLSTMGYCEDAYV